MQLSINPGVVYDTCITGTIYTDTRAGTIYCIQEHGKTGWKHDSLEIIRWNDGGFSLHYEPNDLIEIDELTRAQLDLADQEAQLRSDKRDLAAKIMARGDSTLEHIIRVSMEYHNTTEVTPIVEEGIELYKVGHNASHEFYAGRKDGETWKMSYCADWDDEKQEAIEDKCVYKVEPGKGLGYCGHF